jgi:hypothetical protein
MPKVALWKRWAFVLLPAAVLAISLSNLFGGHAQSSELFVTIISGLLTVMGIGQFLLGKIGE